MLRLFILSWLAFINTALSANLQVSFSELRSQKGNILYLVFKSGQGFPGDASKAVKSGSLPANSPDLVIDLPEGEYAVSVIHDENKNNKLDTFLGIPTEGFGFSNNPRIFFGPPDFDDCRIKLQDDLQIEIEMKHL